VLNPRFVEWLMGYPMGWASVASSSTPSVTQWCQFKRRMRSLLWQVISKEVEVEEE